ncbi:MAG: GAF domain-containing sensor histidine kinase, partial [Methylococcaceae bacterium]
SFRAIAEAAQECLEFSRKNQLSFSVGLAEAVQAGWVEPMKSAGAPLVPMDDKLALWESCNHVASAGSYFVHLALCSYYFGRYEEAAVHLENVKRYLTGLTDNVLKRQWYVFQALNALRLHRQQLGDKPDLSQWIDPVATWADLGPLLQPYLALYRAEWACCFAGFDQACLAYLTAIETARRQGYTFLEGYANECLGEWMMAAGRRSGDTHYCEAMRLYRRCGAQGKEIQLLERCPECFEDERAQESAAIAGEPEGATLPNLDVDYLIKSSLVLSAEVDQEKLLAKIMRVVLQSSGAQHGYLLMPHGEEWVIRASSHVAEAVSVETGQTPLHAAQALCQGIIHYACRTHGTVVLADAQESEAFRHLPEVAAQGLRSLLCLPLLRHGELVGALYLENRLTTGVFTPDKVRLTELLSLQAAISLENARLISEIGQLNSDLEQRVADEVARNREKDHLLIQQSRLAVMGEMINNIAHQWRQPLNALGLVLGNIKDAQRFGELTPEYLHQQEAEGRSYIEKMSTTINDFRDFFRPEKQSESFSLRQAIDGAVTLVSASFKAHGIELLVEHAEDLWIVGFPNEYSQVLLNLLTNAKEAILARGVAQGRIAIRAAKVDGQARVTVTDNGGGIDPVVLPRLFEPYFSTKETGTGIGLYMSKMIIENSMGGHIEVRNIPGGAEFSIVTP